MSADRYEIIYREKPEFVTAECSIEIRFGNRSLHLFSGCSFLETHIAGAIRQQARDLDQLRTDLAAVVAERDKLRAIDCGWIAGQPPRNTCEHCDGTGDVHTPTGEWVGECDCVYAQNNKLRAFKSAVEAAPVVACASYVDAWKVFVRIPNAPMPPIGTELIARPAKD